MPSMAGSLLALVLAAGDLSREAMREDLAELVRGASAQWSYLEDKRAHFGVDLEGLARAEVRALPERATRAEFALVLQRLVAALNDGHGGVRFDPPLPEPARRWPFTLRATSEGLAVERCFAAQGPAVGDLLLAVDGVSAAELWVAQQALAIGSTPGMRRLQALRRMERCDGQASSFAFEGSDGTRTLLELPSLDSADPRLAEPPEASWSVDEPYPGVARLRIASFALPDWQAWLAADQAGRDELLVGVKAEVDALFADLAARAPRALLLDLRGNGGGTDSLGIHFAERLLPGPLVYFKLSSFLDGRWTDPHGYTYGTAEDLPRVVVPTLALIDEGCFSTTDNFLRALDALHPDLTTIGRPTGAGTGAPRVVAELPHTGAKVTLCTQRVFGPDDRLTEGRGTLPDVPVTWSAADLRAGRDADLERARTLLLERGLRFD